MTKVKITKIIYTLPKSKSPPIGPTMSSIKCPSCRGRFELKIFKNILSGYECQNCQGIYLNLRDVELVSPEHKLVEEGDLEISVAQDNDKALVDPILGSVMRKYRYQNNPDRFVEYSFISSRVWLDKGELESISELIGLSNLPKVFSDKFQKDLRDQKISTIVDDKYKELLGDKFEVVNEPKLNSTKNELQQIMSYLNS